MEAKVLALKIVKANGDEHLEVNGVRAHVYEFPRRDMVANLYNWGKLCAFPSPRLNEVVSKSFSEGSTRRMAMGFWSSESEMREARRG